MKLYLSILNVLLFCVCSSLATTGPEKQHVEADLLAVLQHYMQILAQESPTSEPKDGLTMADTSEGRVEGTYVTKGEHGVYFLSENEDNKSKLLITTTEGKNIIYVLQLREELTLISVGNDTLLYYHLEKGDELYKVSPSHLFIALSAVQENTDFEIDLLKRYLPKVSEEEGMDCLKQLLEFPEILMIIDAAKMMDKEGMSGEQNPSLRVLFASVLNLEQALWKKKNVVNSDVQGYTESFMSHVAQASTQLATEKCKTYSTTCPAGRCPYVRPGNQCFGMCGLQCNCWSFLCGDCCTHVGCIKHDDCCSKSGFKASFRCFIPFGFQCDRPFSC